MLNNKNLCEFTFSMKFWYLFDFFGEKKKLMESLDFQCQMGNDLLRHFFVHFLGNHLIFFIFYFKKKEKFDVYVHKNVIANNWCLSWCWMSWSHSTSSQPRFSRGELNIYVLTKYGGMFCKLSDIYFTTWESGSYGNINNVVHMYIDILACKN